MNVLQPCDISWWINDSKSFSICESELFVIVPFYDNHMHL